jgi:hypothetical protein
MRPTLIAQNMIMAVAQERCKSARMRGSCKQIIEDEAEIVAKTWMSMK